MLEGSCGAPLAEREKVLEAVKAQESDVGGDN